MAKRRAGPSGKASGASRGALRVGTSGYQYDHWRGVLYPEKLAKKRWFEHYARVFDTVEINNTFYNLPKADTFRDWRERTPAGFRYALKYSRYGSHIKRLKEPENHVPTFLERADLLGDALGPILVQLPPNFRANGQRLRAFLERLPDDHLWALELRHESWLDDEIRDLLAEHGVARVVHDELADHPVEATADFAYWRFHGPGNVGYSEEAIDRTAELIDEQLAAGLDVYAYFNNDAEGWAVTNAERLRERLA